MKRSRIAAGVCIAAIVVIGLAFVINDIILSSAPTSVPFSLGTVIRNVTYGDSQTLDLYIPNQTTVHPLPLVIFVHGGGMTSGDKSDIAYARLTSSDKSNINPIFLDALASAGYAVASINYRLVPQYKYPAQIEDLKCAIRFLRSNANVYGINGSEIFAFGTSAGGQLVAIAALTGSNSTFDVGPYLNESSSLTAAVDMFGPADLTVGEGCGYTASEITQVFGSNSDNVVLASPTHFVKANSPPILIVHGVNDTLVFESQSAELYNELAAAGDQTQLISVHNMGHWFVQVSNEPINPSLEQIAQDMVNFFDQYR